MQKSILNKRKRKRAEHWLIVVRCWLHQNMPLQVKMPEQEDRKKLIAQSLLHVKSRNVIFAKFTLWNVNFTCGADRILWGTTSQTAHHGELPATEDLTALAYTFSSPTVHYQCDQSIFPCSFVELANPNIQIDNCKWRQTHEKKRNEWKTARPQWNLELVRINSFAVLYATDGLPSVTFRCVRCRLKHKLFVYCVWSTAYAPDSFIHARLMLMSKPLNYGYWLCQSLELWERKKEKISCRDNGQPPVGLLFTSSLCTVHCIWTLNMHCVSDQLTILRI